MELLNCFATCKLGLESVVAAELRALGVEVKSVRDARIDFLTDEQALFRVLLFLRAAERVLLTVGEFEAKSFEELFEGVKALPWKKYLRSDNFIHVNGKSAKSALFSVSDCQSITKKAIVENLFEALHVNMLNEQGKEIIVEVGILRDQVTLALDACGAGLSRRGYRTYNVAAPLSETLGAGLVLLSRYRGEGPFLDPMCGSGTIPIEAAMIATRRAPGLNRGFAAENWHFLNKKEFDLAKEYAMDSTVNIPLEIEGCDCDARSLELCKRHAKKAGIMIKWANRMVQETPAQARGGILITNPPYGERMLDKKQTERLYQEMRIAFDRLEGWKLHIISAHKEFERKYGKTANRRRKLSNGGMPCTLYSYFNK